MSPAILLDQSSHRRSGHDPHVAGERAFVFLVGHDRINLAAADQRDVAGLRPAHVFLEENSLRIIDVLEPRARVLDLLAEDRMHRAGRGTERVFDDVGHRLPAQDFLRFQPVGRDVRLRETGC